MGYAQYGSVDGKPVFYFAGGNSSRLEGRCFDRAARPQAVRLLVPDRPGFGPSDDQPKRTFLAWPGDVAQLADALGKGRFGVFGVSGEAPHVAADGGLLRRQVADAQPDGPDPS